MGNDAARFQGGEAAFLKATARGMVRARTAGRRTAWEGAARAQTQVPQSLNVMDEGTGHFPASAHVRGQTNV
eukprot:CAMPEP_0206045578 /NCGR_PEP_ID=MMETSP1466-20131121/16280_1 /ASSEMBLY_ACC=CAM_ASM_001126 /TAXON_ID=44452 /ORGANISM="Pavlova gyrans, Strain CCMP608" /LENGTH=71 /DNA_ID=CAMNT_0053420519 /DNA_START=37 /DNA_END=253 /DNA_ORIENTATION=+